MMEVDLMHSKLGSKKVWKRFMLSLIKELFIVSKSVNCFTVFNPVPKEVKYLFFSSFQLRQTKSLAPLLYLMSVEKLLLASIQHRFKLRWATYQTWSFRILYKENPQEHSIFKKGLIYFVPQSLFNHMSGRTYLITHDISSLSVMIVLLLFCHKCLKGLRTKDNPLLCVHSWHSQKY